MMPVTLCSLEKSNSQGAAGYTQGPPQALLPLWPELVFIQDQDLLPVAQWNYHGKMGSP